MLNDLLDEFESVCYQAFEFLLTDFGFAAPEVTRGRDSVEFIYKNATTAVEVYFPPRESLIDCWLYELHEGQLPHYATIGERDRDTTNMFHSGDLIALREPACAVDQRLVERNYALEEIDRIVCAYAEGLRLLGQDVLQGDFRVFPELGKIVSRRIEEWKQGRS